MMTTPAYPKSAKAFFDQAGNVVQDPIRLVRYLARLLKDDRVPNSAKISLLGSGLYGWLDTDLIPDDIEAVPGLGYVDDLILIVHGIKCLIAETDKHVAVELWPGDAASFKRVMTAVAWLDNQLFERARGAIKQTFEKIFQSTPNQPSK